MDCFVAFWLVQAVLLCCAVLRAQEISPSVASKHMTACRYQIGDGKEDVINLEPLARKDGYPRFLTTFNVGSDPWNYSFNPCQDYDLPRSNPHQGFGDLCHSVAICKFQNESKRLYHFTMGIHSTAIFRVPTTTTTTDPTKPAAVELVYKGIKSMRARDFIIELVCDKTKTTADQGVFTITQDTGQGPLHAELEHLCCCPGGCWNAGQGTGGGNQSLDTQVAESSDAKKGKKEEGLLLIIIGTAVAVLMLVALIGGLCYIKRTHLQIYSKLPVKAGQSAMGMQPKPANLRDYEPASSNRKKVLPILENTMIHRESLEMCQRLGGGIFGDTHLAKWHEMSVGVKRLTLLVHENQITPEAMKLMKNEVWFLSRQRHRNIVTILGLCLDGKLPSIITEYVIGECLKDFIKVQGRLLTWPHRVRMCSQVADGMAFLHSTKPPIIHRDLRCGNLFLSDNDVVKVADFGLIKLLQPVREECPTDDCCCRRTMSACPASIRWTAPELLADPVAKETLAPSPRDPSETDSNNGSGGGGGGRGCKEVITPACDVFSFAMVMWEIPMCQDPFQEISEVEVQEVVKHGGRPETPPSAEMMPHYKELMKSCWEQAPATRPTFKQVATRLKDLATQARSYQKQLQSRQRMQKSQQNTLQSIP